MEINNLQQIQKEIVKQIKLLLNSKFESREKIIINNTNNIFNLKREHLLTIFNNNIDKKKIREYVKTNFKGNNLICIDCDKGIFITSEMRIKND